MEEVEETTCICQLRECPDADNAFSVSTFVLRCNISIRKNPHTTTGSRRGALQNARFSDRTPRRGLATMECTINWVPASGMAFVAETGSGHLLTMDGAPDGGGRNLAPRPMETLLAGAGACTAYDVVLILKRGRHEVSGCQLKVSSERATTDPKVFTKIHLHFVVSGRKLPAAAVERAIALSHEKYCSATIMLSRTAEVTTGYEIVEA